MSTTRCTRPTGTRNRASVGVHQDQGLNALLAVASTQVNAPVIVGHRLRAGATNSARGREVPVRRAGRGPPGRRDRIDPDAGWIRLSTRTRSSRRSSAARGSSPSRRGWTGPWPGPSPTFPRTRGCRSSIRRPCSTAAAEHRDHGIVEQVISDLKSSALAHFRPGE